MTPLSARVRQAISVLFAPSSRSEAALLLEEFCVEFPDASWDQLLERIRMAVLKLSNGDIAQLCQALDLAATDWRDLLVAAGFADPLAHLEWTPAAERHDR